MNLKLNVHQYKKHFGKNEKEHEIYAENIKTIIRKTCPTISNFVEVVDIFNLIGQSHNHKAGKRDKRMVIFNYGTTCPNVVPETVGNLTIFGEEADYGKFLPPEGNGILIMSSEDIVLAEWKKETYELNILFDLFGELNDHRLHIFEQIMKQFNDLVIKPNESRMSWKYTNDKIELTKIFQQQIRSSKETIIKKEKEQVAILEDKIKQATQQLKSYYENLINKRNIIEIEENNLENSLEKLIEDLDLIIKQEKVADLHIKNNKFIVYTKPLYAYTEKGERFYVGSYRIEINPSNTQIKFFGDNPRHGYWTSHDPHPHVNGETNEACLGNIASTVAELCAQMQIYALTLILIDFLETANIKDVAGRKIYRWDMVDEDGNIIREGGNYSTCQNCGEISSTLHNACQSVRYEVGHYYHEGHHVICDRCAENYYTFDGRVNTYVRRD